jgi:hypothetical protein
MRGMVVGSCILLFSVGAVEAGWYTHEDDDPFAKKLTLLAISSETGVIFRCSKRGQVDVVVVTDQRVPDEVAASFQNADVNINVGIYIDDERFDLMASLDLTSDKLVRATTDSAVAVTIAAAAAKKRIAVAVQVADKTIYRVNPGIVGAASAIAKLVKGCGLDLTKTN